MIHALKRLGCDDCEEDIRAVVQNTEPEVAREGRLTWRAFHLVFPDLPMAFASPPANEFFTATAPQVADLLVKPDTARLVQLHAEMKPAIASDRPLGLIFRYGRTRGGHILHDGDPARFGGGTSIRTGGRELIYNRFYVVLDAMAAGDMQSVEIPVTRPAQPFDPGLPIPPSIPRELGCGVSARVMALIDQLCSRQLPRGKHRWSHWIDGERWVRCRQCEMARLIRCSPAAIKKATKQLTSSSMLESRRTVEGNAYRLGPALRQDTTKEAP